MIRSTHSKILLGLALIFIAGNHAWAASPEAAAAATTFLWLAVLLLLAKISGLVEKIGCLR